MKLIIAGLALGVALLSVPAAADDPKDSAMRSAAARARDREQIRQLNLAQLDYVRRRDAGYAEGWAASRATGEAGGATYAERSRQHRAALASHAAAQAEYDRQMAQWRRQVSACRAGDWDACQ